MERNHRTVKRSWARSGGQIEDAVFWHNSTPNESGVVPFEALRVNGVRLPQQRQSRDADNVDIVGNNPYQPGDRVYVKPPGARCTTPWVVRVVDSVVSNVAVVVDGVQRHIRDVRPACESGSLNPSAPPQVVESSNSNSIVEWDSDSDDSTGSNSNEDEAASVSRVARNRAPPGRFADYYMLAACY